MWKVKYVKHILEALVQLSDDKTAAGLSVHLISSCWRAASL